MEIVKKASCSGRGLMSVGGRPILHAHSPIRPFPHSMTRDFTATTFVVQDDRTLLLFHRKIGAWFPPGGHIDPDELPDDAARREVREETGLEVELLSSRRPLGEVEVLGRPECILLEDISDDHQHIDLIYYCLLYTSPSPRDGLLSRMPSSA